MREYIFRGKNKDIGWVYGQLVFDINGNPYIVKEVEQDSSYGLEETMLCATLWYRVDPETVSPYIRRNDSKENKIYIGDILKHNYYRSRYADLYIVKENINGCELRKIHKPRSLKSLTFTDRMEVIGNIWDNPELLEGDE